MAITQCTLSEYRKFTADLACPSDDQIYAFVEFVSGAHSWYKHLPLTPPGIIFYFFLDPFAGYDRTTRADGRVVCSPRGDECRNLHYSLLPTEVYRARFGYLSYSPIDPFFVDDLTAVLNDHLPVFSTRDRAYRVPDEIAIAGSAEVTAVIHFETHRPWSWLCRWGREESADAARDWPEETGGQATIQKIVDICKRSSQRSVWSDDLVQELSSILTPETHRLQGNMAKSIRRMLSLVRRTKST